MDGDARLGPVCELIVNGRYCWLPFAAIAEIRFQAPASVTDLGAAPCAGAPDRWKRAGVSDPRALPCHAAGGSTASSSGRATEWQPLDDEGALYQGHGQKVWLNDNDEFPFSLDVVSFA